MIEYGDNDNDDDDTIPYHALVVAAAADKKESAVVVSIKRRSGVWRMVKLIAPPLRIVEMWINMGQTWDGMFDFLKASLTPNADADCTEISAADVAADPPTTASSLEVMISAALDIQQL